MNANLMTVGEAQRAQMVPLTRAFAAATEPGVRMVCRDLERGGIAHCLVQRMGGVEVWRTRRGFRTASTSGRRAKWLGDVKGGLAI